MIKSKQNCENVVIKCSERGEKRKITKGFNEKTENKAVSYENVVKTLFINKNNPLLYGKPYSQRAVLKKKDVCINCVN